MTTEARISYIGVGCTVVRREETFTISKDDKWGEMMNDPRVVISGETIGELNKKWLHERLDYWIENGAKP